MRAFLVPRLTANRVRGGSKGGATCNKYISPERSNWLELTLDPAYLHTGMSAGLRASPIRKNVVMETGGVT